MTPRTRILARSALVLLAAALPQPAARASDLAPGNPPLTSDLADLRRDAVEVVFDFQMTARQIAEHRRLYAWCWKYAPADWQKAEAAALPEFRDVLNRSAADRTALREKHKHAWWRDAVDQAAKGNPYHQWLLAEAEAAAKIAVPGEPPLRHDAREGFIEFLDWGLNLRLTSAQRAEFREVIAREWMKTITPADRVAVGEKILPLYRKVLRMSPAERDGIQAKMTAALLPVLDKSPTPTDRWLRAAHQSANQVLDASAPALTGAVAAMGPEFFEWALGAKLPAEAHRVYREGIIKHWKETPEADRRAIVRTAEMMRNPPTGAAGETQRARDRAHVLINSCWHPDHPLNAALLAAYRAAHPTAGGPTVPPAGKVLMAGDPPLTERAADAARHFFEWVLGVEFTPAERAAFRQTQLDEWKRKDIDAMRGTLEVARFWAEAATFPAADRELIRVTVRPQVLDSIRQTKDTDPGNRWLLTRYEAKKPATKDRPWLTPDVPDAAVELLAFQAAEASGQPADSPAVREAAKKAVTSAVSAGSTELAQAPVKLAELRAAWAGMSAAARQELRDEWADRLGPLALTGKLAAWQTKPAPSPVRPSTNAFLDAQKKLYQQQQTTRMISDMMRMQHQTNMTIIRNMGSTPYRYEYKYVPRRR